MRNITSEFKTEKNKQENKPVYLYTIFDYDGESNNLYFINYDTNIVFDSVTYIKFPIRHEPVGENIRGEIDAVRVIIGNVSREIQGYLENNDLRQKKVTIKQIWANDLENTDNYIEDTFYIDSYTADVNAVEFTLTSKTDVLDQELPGRRYSRYYCSWTFKSTECGYSGEETTCNRTLHKCRELSNEERFGGFPSIPQRRAFGV